MTDRSDPRAPKSSRKKPAREPATIDLKATVIDDGTRQDGQENHEKENQEKMWEGVKPEETISPSPEPKAEDTVASPDATLDSGAGTDSISPEVVAQEPPGQDIPPRDPPPDVPPFQEPSAPASHAHDPSVPGRPAKGTSAAALIGSGLLGGLVGAGLVYGAQVWFAPDAPVPVVRDDQRIVQLEQRLNALGQQGSQQGDLPAVQGRLQALESADATVDQRLQEIRSAAEQAAARAEEALNRPLPQAPAPETSQALNEISGRLSSLESQVQSVGQNIQSVGQNATEAAQSASTVADTVQGLERRLSELESRLSGQDQRLAELTGQVSERNRGAQSAAQAGTRVILAERLGDALNNGDPYADVLEGLRKFEADPARLAPLEPFAQAGAPTAAALAQSFEPLGAQILRESRAPADDWTDRVLRMMDRVVTIRPVDEPGTTGVSSLVTRIEQALERGDVAAAAEAWQALPEPARRLSEEWGRQVAAVAQANQASQAIADNALAALNRTSQ